MASGDSAIYIHRGDHPLALPRQSLSKTLVSSAPLPLRCDVPIDAIDKRVAVAQLAPDAGMECRELAQVDVPVALGSLGAGKMVATAASSDG